MEKKTAGSLLTSHLLQNFFHHCHVDAFVFAKQILLYPHVLDVCLVSKFVSTFVTDVDESGNKIVPPCAWLRSAMSDFDFPFFFNYPPYFT